MEIENNPKQSMPLQWYRVTWSNGFEMFQARSFADASKWATHTAKRNFLTVVSVALDVDVEFDN